MLGCLSQHFSPGCTLGKERSIVTPPPPSLRSPQGTCAVTFFKLETGWGTRKPAFEGFLNSWFLSCCVWVILHEITFGVYWSVMEGMWWGSIGAILESPRDVVLIPGIPRECFRKFPVDFPESSGLAFGVVVWEFRPFGLYMIIEVPRHSFRRSPASFGPRPLLFTPYCLFCKYFLSIQQMPGPAHAFKVRTMSGRRGSGTSDDGGMEVVSNTRRLFPKWTPFS